MRQHGIPTKYPGVQKIKEGVFRIRVKVVDPRTGKPKEADKLVTGMSAQQAAKERSNLLAELKAASESHLERARLRIGDFATSWLKSKTHVLDDRTARRYAEALDLHILPRLGDLYFDVLRPADVQDWVNVKLKEKNPKSKDTTYAVDTIRAWFRVLRTMTRDAFVELDLARDPTVRITFPDGEGKSEVNALTPSELVAFLDSMRRLYPKNYALTVMLALTGLRFCHASGIKWEDVDEERGVVSIVRKNSRGKVGSVSRKKRAPKEIPLVPELLTVLREQRQMLVAAQAPGLKDGWVFPSEVGTLRFAGSLWKAWRGSLKAAGVSHRFTVHGLRRTFNDLARRAGVDSVVTRALTGHVTERMREHYSTVGLDEKQAAIEGVVRLLPKAKAVGTEVGTETEKGDSESEAPVVTTEKVGT